MLINFNGCQQSNALNVGSTLKIISSYQVNLRSKTRLLPKLNRGMLALYGKNYYANGAETISGVFVLTANLIMVNPNLILYLYVTKK